MTHNNTKSIFGYTVENYTKAEIAVDRRELQVEIPH